MSTWTASAWQAVIGLEVHCQLATATKLFCGCRNAFGEPPNSLVCPVCTGQPGALPVFNAEALDLALRAALALGCDIATWAKFDRKHYFYCDLPKGFQISQYDQPFCRGGGIALSSGKRVRLVRIHLEEDAGKAIHDRGPSTLVDLNRAGVPLIESVTEPDLASAAEAHEYLSALKEILQFVGASECDMEKGSLRCDVNVSVRRAGEPLGTKVELKNLNSFSNVVAALDHEIARQIAGYESGDRARFPVQETRLFDAASGTTRTMRSKEDAHDYRYFPDPDLPPFTISRERIERMRSHLPELPAARRKRYRESFGLSEYDAGVMASSRAVSDFFEAVVRHSNAPKDAANWIGNEVLALFAEATSGVKSIDELAFKPFDLAELIALVNGGQVNRPGGRAILRAMLASPKAPRELLRELGLEQVGASPELETWCREALAGKDKIVAEVRAGNDKALGALIGPVMKASGGKASPQAVRDTLLELIRGSS
jgi:aspartyl-tRNA(Asn)/glutamyl-tRNA(Gln) amidotransferase subunit B